MELRFFQYRIPLVQRFKTSKQSLAEREGIIIQLQHDGLTAWGEAAPLPGFSNESLVDVREQLKRHSSRIKKLLQEKVGLFGLNGFYEKNDIVPSLCFALDTLLCSYQAQIEDLPISRLLFEDPIEIIPLNAVIDILPAKETLQQARKHIEKGYSTLKFKVGNDMERELPILRNIRHHFPEVTLRVDANCAWRFDEALENLSELEELDIEYCEEPLRQPTLKALEKLSATSPVPVALDETLTSPGVMESVAPFIPVLIHKPMVIGKISNLFATKQLAATHDNKLIYTSALESGVGRMMTAILASGLGSRPAAHGLATGSLLTLDVWYDGTYINNGYFSMPGDFGANKRYRPDLQSIAEEIHLQSE